MSDKKIVKYTNVHFYGRTNPVGESAYVTTVDHPNFSEWQQKAIGLDTSPVQSYDESTGVFETLNTVYVPATSTIEDAA